MKFGNSGSQMGSGVDRARVALCCSQKIARLRYIKLQNNLQGRVERPNLAVPNIVNEQ